MCEYLLIFKGKISCIFVENTKINFPKKLLIAGQSILILDYSDKLTFRNYIFLKEYNKLIDTSLQGVLHILDRKILNKTHKNKRDTPTPPF